MKWRIEIIGIWMLAHLVSVEGISIGPLSNDTEQKPHAVAMAWFWKGGPPSDVKDFAKTLCPAVLSLRMHSRSAEAARRVRSQALAPIAQIMVTDGSTLPAKVRKFLVERGIRVVDIENDPLEQHIKSMASRWRGDGLVNMLKLAPLWRTDLGYSAVQLVDWDNFMVGAVDLLTPAAEEGRTAIRKGSMTPTNGGFVAMRPSAQVGASLERALEHGFSLRTGWGGNYSQEDLLLSKPFVDAFCKFNMLQPCCSAKSRNPWCFSASDLDQGLLFHLMIDGGRKSGFPRHSGLPVVHTTLHPKPWEIEKLPKNKLALIGPGFNGRDGIRSYYSNMDRFYQFVYPFARETFQNDSVCGPFFNEQYELYSKRSQGSGLAER